MERHFPLVQCRGDSSNVVALSEASSLHAGAQLVKEGSASKHVFMIYEGQCNVTINGEVVGELGVGDICGDIPLLTYGKHPSTVTAVTDISYYSIDYKVMKLEMYRTRRLDPAGFEVRAKMVLDQHVRRFNIGHDHIKYGFKSYVEEGADLTSMRIDKVRTDVSRTPWHGIAGVYVMLSTLVAFAWLPFCPREVPLWWLLTFVSASAWLAGSGSVDWRTFAFKGLGTFTNFESGIACQFIYSYLALRFSWDNMSLQAPVPINWLDLVVAAACSIRLYRWSAIYDPTWFIFAINITQVLVPTWWFLYFLKPAWLEAVLNGNDYYNLALAMILQAGGNAGTYFAATLDVRGLITREQNLLLNVVFGFLIPTWPAFVAAASNWPVFFDLITLNKWIEYPFLGFGHP